VVQHADIDHTGITGTGSGSSQLDYVALTSTVNVTATTEATANTIVTGSAVVYDGSTAVLIHFFAPEVFMDADDRNITFVLYDGSSAIGVLARYFVGDIHLVGDRFAGHAFVRLTPSAASHTYSIRAFTNAGTQQVSGGAGGSATLFPGFIRIDRA
jgi:hypothetical protein